MKTILIGSKNIFDSLDAQEKLKQKNKKLVLRS